MDKEEIKKNFIESFTLQSEDFSEPEIFIDDKIGFSTQKKLSPELKEKLKITEGKEYISLIHVGLRDQDFDENLEDIPITIRIGLTLKRGDDFLINDNFIKNKKYQPIDLFESEDYSYNHKQNRFYRKSEISDLNRIIKEIYDLHIKPGYIFQGFKLRWKLKFWRHLLPGSFNLIAQSCSSFHWLITGRKLSYKLFEQSIEIEAEEEKGNMLNFYGYQVGLQTIFVYSSIHLIALIIIFSIPIEIPQYFKGILSNGFLTITYAILTLTILDKGFPKILKYIFEEASKQKSNILFRRIRI